jgi:hypothetical protein
VTGDENLEEHRSEGLGTTDLYHAAGLMYRPRWKCRSH